MEQSRRKDEVTQLLAELSAGNRAAMDRLMPMVYDELRALAHHKLQFEKSDHTLNTTALVHEAYFRLVNQRSVAWQNRAHFYAIAAQAMRRVLVNYAEKRRAAKRGGDPVKVPLSHISNRVSDENTEEFLALNDALDRLRAFDERGALVVEYRFFGGLSYDDIAEVLGVSKMTVRRAWMLAKTWLHREMKLTLSPS